MLLAMIGMGVVAWVSMGIIDGMQNRQLDRVITGLMACIAWAIYVSNL